MILKEIVETIARNHRVSSYEHKQVIKLRVLSLSAKLLRQHVERNGEASTSRLTYIIDVKIVDINDVCNITSSNCKVLRGVNKIIKPIEPNGQAPFIYVGNAEFDLSFPYVKTEIAIKRNSLRFANNIPTYDYLNDYLYIVGNIRYEKIRIIGLYLNRELLRLCTSDDTASVCFDEDNTEFPLPNHLVDDVISIISNDVTMRESTSEIEKIKIDENDSN